MFGLAPRRFVSLSPSFTHLMSSSSTNAHIQTSVLDFAAYGLLALAQFDKSIRAKISVLMIKSCVQ